MLEYFQHITGSSASRYHIAIAFCVLLLAAYLLLLTMISAWQRHKADELEQEDIIWITGRALMLFFVIAWIIV